MENSLSIFRHEVKYYISKREALELGLLLKNLMILDDNANNNKSYWIRSLYFDTINNKDYYEKVIGYNVRKKIRLRIYDLDTDVVKLEIKNKENKYINKETMNISREDAEKLIIGDSYPLLSYKANTTNKVFAYMHRDHYLPKVVIDYEREAYFLPFENIRVTIDKNIRSSTNTDIYFSDNTTGMLPIFNEDITVLEIKYESMIPIFLQRIFSNFTTQGSQISKYCLGRNNLRK